MYYTIYMYMHYICIGTLCVQMIPAKALLLDPNHYFTVSDFVHILLYPLLSINCQFTILDLF